MKTLLKYAVLIVIFFVLSIPALSKIIEASSQDNRWIYICNDIDQADIKYYYDSETVTYISNNQVSVWIKTISPYNKPQLMHIEISCASNMFHLMENSYSLWGDRINTSYIAGKWIDTPPDSEVYLLSKLVCKNPKAVK
jgi:hypothetical protein